MLMKHAGAGGGLVELGHLPGILRVGALKRAGPSALERDANQQ